MFQGNSNKSKIIIKNCEITCYKKEVWNDQRGEETHLPIFVISLDVHDCIREHLIFGAEVKKTTIISKLDMSPRNKNLLKFRPWDGTPVIFVPAVA